MNMPFLQAHICIVPHAKVDSHEHYYSYSSHANDVAFHSPLVLDDSSTNLSDFLATQMRRNSLSSAEEIQSIDDVAEKLKWALPESILAQVEPRAQEFGILWIKKIGMVLRKEYGIHQLLLVRKRRMTAQ